MNLHVSASDSNKDHESAFSFNNGLKVKDWSYPVLIQEPKHN